jgi:heat-inducible transcriptional repressor
MNAKRSPATGARTRRTLTRTDGRPRPSSVLACRAVDDCELKPRQAELLGAVCRAYLLGGGDVPSSELARAIATSQQGHAQGHGQGHGQGHVQGWSSATIRAELAHLERMGLVDRAHRSAGCRPTRAGLERYVRTHPRPSDPPPPAARAVDRSLGEGATVEQDVRATARVLSEVGGCIAVTFVADPECRRIREVELVPIAAARVLVVVGFEGGATTMHAVDLEDPARVDPSRELPAIQAKLRELCLGRTLASAHTELVRLRRDLESSIDHRLAEVVRVGLSLCEGAELDPLALTIAGQARLARGLGDVGAEGLGEVLAALEDDRRLASLLCQLLPPGVTPRAEVLLGGRALLDGSRDGSPRGQDDGDRTSALRLALVGCRLPTAPLGPARVGAIAVLGPDRLDYASVIPLVEYAARALATRG